ncbi:MAG: cell envelope integrity protein CreD [Pseudomonadota bacterium]
MPQDDESKAEKPSPEPAQTNFLYTTLSSPGAKFILIGIITVLLLIPATMVWVLVEERAARADQVAQSISQGWGGQQIINGPYLVIPYRITEIVNDKTVTVGRKAIISPEKLEISADATVEERKKSIYKTQLYNLKTKLSGSFSELNLERLTDRGAQLETDRAYLVMAIADPTGFRSDVIMKGRGNAVRKFKPGLRGITAPKSAKFYNRGYSSTNPVNHNSGVHLPVTVEEVNAGFDFTIDMALNGSRELSFMPAAKTTQLVMKANWPHPGFDGRFLPETREINPEGFSANWTVPELARGIDAVYLSSSLPSAETVMRVNFVEPLKFYQVTSRTLKYSIAFFSLIFLAIFILELNGKNLIHWIQYILTGLAMVIFYVLLLALAEQIGFTLAYLLSSAATTFLIAWYIGDSLGSKNGSKIMGGVLAVTYFIMYLILNEEQYALLAGSIIAFLAIATTMFTTRNINWSNKKPIAEKSA